MNILVNSFNTGEISRLAEHRVDQPRRHSGATLFRNMLPRVFGGAMSRPGTEFLGLAKQTDAPILIPFAFSTTTAYVIEAGANYFRFWNQDGTPVLSDGAPFEVITPYAQGDLIGLRHAQANDIMYFVHPSHPVYKLTRVEEDNWTFAAVDFGADGNWPPMRDINAEDITLTPTQDPAANGILWKYTTYTGGTQAPSNIRNSFRGGAAGVASGTGTVPALGLYGSEALTNFAYYIETWLKVTATGTHNFRSVSDDGSALWINGTQVFNGTTAGTFNGSISLTPGFHKVELVYVQGIGAKAWAAATAFQWQPPGAGSYAQVPAGSQYRGFLNTATIVANADVFQVGHVGSFWMVGHDRTDSAVKLDLSATGNSAVMRILGDWTLSTLGTWHGILLVQRSDDGSSNWQTVRSYQSLDGAARNVSASGREERETYLRLSFTDGAGTPASSPNAVLEAADPVVYSLLRITSVTNAQSAKADIINGLYATTATTNWAEGAWSNVRGFPASVTFHEQRLMVAAGQRVWGSVIGDWENFRLTTLDDGALDILLGATQSHGIQWLRSFNGALAIGTNATEWILDPGESGSTLTPVTLRQRMVSTAGSGNVPALVAGDVILFLQRNGRKWRELVYSLEKDGYVSPDMNLLSEHVLGTGVRCAALQRQDDTILWCVREDGLLASMSYDRQQEFTAWATHDTRQGFDTFQWVTVLPGGNNEPDQVWFVVKREIDTGGPKMMVERFHPDSMIWTTASDPASCPLDCATVVKNADEIVGLDRFRASKPAPPGAIPENYYADRPVVLKNHVSYVAQYPGQTDPESGTQMVDLGETYDVAAIGYIIGWTLRPVYPHVDLQDGASRGRVTRINGIEFFYDRGIQIEVNTYREEEKIRTVSLPLWRTSPGVRFSHPGDVVAGIPAAVDVELLWSGASYLESLDGKWSLASVSGIWDLYYIASPGGGGGGVIAATSTAVADFPQQSNYTYASAPIDLQLTPALVRQDSRIWHTGQRELFNDTGWEKDTRIEFAANGPFPIHITALVWKITFAGQ